MKYDVFISYSRADFCFEDNTINPNSIVSKVLKTLDDNNISYWIDKQGIYSGSEFADVIGAAIEESYVFVYISSVNSNSSEWTLGEVSSAKEIKHPIVPFKVDDTPYNRKIRLILSPLDYIDYMKLGERAFDELVSAIKKHVDILKSTGKGELQTQYDTQCDLIQDEIAGKRSALKELLDDMTRLGLDISKYEEFAEFDYKKYKLEKENEILKLKGDISALESKYAKSQPVEVEIKRWRRKARIFRVLVFLMLVPILFLAVGLYVTGEQSKEYRDQYLSLHTENTVSKAQQTMVVRQIGEMVKIYPCIITDINVSRYGSRITPIIKYDGFVEKEVNLEIKLIPLSTKLVGESIQSVIESYVRIVNIEEGYRSVVLEALEKKEGEEWSRGVYKMEIWYKGVCLGTRKFDI